jgi:hypothetical protein
MAFNGSGTFNRLYNWINDRANDVNIRADRMDAEMDGFATGLTTCVTKNGQTNPTANLPMAGFRHTGVGAAQAADQYATVAGVQNGAYSHLTSVSGADTITANAPLTLTEYAVGQRFRFVSAGANTTAVTLNIDGLGAKDVTKNGSTALAAGDIAASAIVEVVYDGTRFQATNLKLGTMAQQAASSVAITGGTATLNNTGLKVLDTNASHTLGLVPGSDLTANRTLTITTGDADRTVTLSANLTVSATATVSGTNTGDTVAASQAEMEAASSSTVMVTPGNLKYHPGVAKVWGHYYHNAGVPTIRESYNISSLTDNGTGDTTVNLTVSFSNATFATVGNYNVNMTTDPNSNTGQVLFSGHSTGSFRVNTYNTANSALDCAGTWVAAFGDQA